MMCDILRQVAPSVHGDHATHGSFEAFFILGANIAKKTWEKIIAMKFFTYRMKYNSYESHLSISLSIGGFTPSIFSLSNNGLFINTLVFAVAPVDVVLKVLVLRIYL